MDLNLNTLPRSSNTLEVSVSESSSSVNEIDATAVVGSMLGFEMEASNPLLAEILGEYGEKKDPQ